MGILDFMKKEKKVPGINYGTPVKNPFDNIDEPEPSMPMQAPVVPNVDEPPFRELVSAEAEIEQLQNIINSIRKQLDNASERLESIRKKMVQS